MYKQSKEEKNDNNNNNKNKSNRLLLILLIILLLVILILAGITVWALFLREANPSEDDYAPTQIEDNAEKIEDSKGTKLEQPQGGGSVSLTYSNVVTLSLSTKEAALMFQNPFESNQDMKLEIVISEKSIVQSGRLEPGYMVKKLSNVYTEKLSPGKYAGKFVISFYDETSGEKAIVNTEIPITITVVE